MSGAGFPRQYEGDKGLPALVSDVDAFHADTGILVLDIEDISMDHLFLYMHKVGETRHMKEKELPSRLRRDLTGVHSSEWQPGSCSAAEIIFS